MKNVLRSTPLEDVFFRVRFLSALFVFIGWLGGLDLFT